MHDEMHHAGYGEAFSQNSLLRRGKAFRREKVRQSRLRKIRSCNLKRVEISYFLLELHFLYFDIIDHLYAARWINNNNILFQIESIFFKYLTFTTNNFIKLM